MKFAFSFDYKCTQDIEDKARKFCKQIALPIFQQVNEKITIDDLYAVRLREVFTGVPAGDGDGYRDLKTTLAFEVLSEKPCGYKPQ